MYTTYMYVYSRHACTCYTHMKMIFVGVDTICIYLYSIHRCSSLVPHRDELHCMACAVDPSFKVEPVDLNPSPRLLRPADVLTAGASRRLAAF